MLVFVVLFAFTVHKFVSDNIKTIKSEQSSYEAVILLFKSYRDILIDTVLRDTIVIREHNIVQLVFVKLKMLFLFCYMTNNKHRVSFVGIPLTISSLFLWLIN